MAIFYARSRRANSSTAAASASIRFRAARARRAISARRSGVSASPIRWFMSPGLDDCFMVSPMLAAGCHTGA